LGAAAWRGNVHGDTNTSVLAKDHLSRVSLFARAVGGSLDQGARKPFTSKGRP
jgi:hypothetical protein